MEDKACLYNHFGGAKALFCYVNPQVNDAVGAVEPCKMFHLGTLPPVPTGDTWNVPDLEGFICFFV